MTRGRLIFWTVCPSGLPFVSTKWTAAIGGRPVKIAIPVWVDTRVEPDESVTIALGTPGGPVVLTRSIWTGTVFTDD